MVNHRWVIGRSEKQSTGKTHKHKSPAGCPETPRLIDGHRHWDLGSLPGGGFGGEGLSGIGNNLGTKQQVICLLDHVLSHTGLIDPSYRTEPVLTSNI